MSENIKLYLCDLNTQLISAWEQEFKDCPNVIIKFGNIFEIFSDAIISPANSFGFMDGGIDLAYSKYFGWDLQKRLQEKINLEFNGELPIGTALTIPTGRESIRYVISCPTMRVPEYVTQSVNAYLAFRAGLIETKKYNLKSVSCPGLGTGSGRLPFQLCAKQMRRAYDKIICGKNNFPENLNLAFREHYILKN